MPIPDDVRDLLDARCRVAVVGANNHPRKYGHIITRFLLDRGFDVRPVNPNVDAVLGRDAVATVAEAGPVDIVDFVVPPPASLEVVEGLAGDGPVLWFQPGSFDRRVVEAARARSSRVLAGPCIMVEAR